MSPPRPHLPGVWEDALIARELRRRPELTVTLHLCYNPRGKGLREKLDKRGVDPDNLGQELSTILAFKRRPSTTHQNTSYTIHTPRLTLVVISAPLDDITCARIVDAQNPKRDLPEIAVPNLHAYLYEMSDAVGFDLDRAHRDYEAARQAARGAAFEAAFGEPPRSPAQRLRDELDRQLLPAQAILDLTGKREEVVTAATADGVVARGDDALDVLRVRLSTLSGVFVEDADVTLHCGETAINAEVVEGAGDEVLLRPKFASDVSRLPEPGSPIRLVRAKPHDNRAVRDAILNARQGKIVGDWDGLTRLLTAPGTLAPAAAPEGILVDPELSDKQADAVRGAISASHAFFIQGPPGTGKTRVIAEIVRQLAWRGERVLLVAPMHVAVDAALDRLREDPLVWPMRVAAKEDNIRDELKHLRENAVEADAAGRLRARLGSRNQKWIADQERLNQRLRALDELRTATAELAAAAAALTQLERSGEREAIAAGIAGDQRTIAAIQTGSAAAESAATAAQSAVAELTGRITAAEAEWAGATALHAGLRAARQEIETAGSAADRMVTAARRRLRATGGDLTIVDERLAALAEQIAALRGTYADSWRGDAAAFRAYLADLDRRITRQRSDHKRTTARAIAAADQNISGIEARIAGLKLQREHAQDSMSRFNTQAEQAARRGREAASHAAAADAEYSRAKAGATFFSKLGDGVGLGKLAAKRGEITRADRRRADAEQAASGNHAAAAVAARQISTAAAGLTAAEAELAKARKARTNQAGEHADQAAELERRQAAITQLRAQFAADRGFAATLADLYQLSRAANSPDVARESARAARALCTGRRTAARELIALCAERDQVSWSRIGAQEQHGWQSAEVARCEHQRADVADLITEARAADDAQTAAADRLGAVCEQVRAARDRATAGGLAALAEGRRLEDERTTVTRHQDALRDELAVVLARLDAATAQVARSTVSHGHALDAARHACDGELPTDLAEGLAGTRARLNRVQTLISLEDRWRDLVSGGGVEELGHAVIEATNLVCATVTGIAGSPSAKQADFDTLILDEASRVIDADFLVPAVRARRWILVGDERQLPPYVDQETEQHIHALLALRAAERDRIPVATAVDQVAGLHEELLPDRPIRREPTVDLATRMDADGSWTAQYRPHLDQTLAELGDNLALLPGDKRQRDPVLSLITALAGGQSVSRFEKCVTLPATEGMRTQLTTQRRMVAPIADLVKMPVYHGRYDTPPAAELLARRIRPFTGADYPNPVTFYNSGRSARAAELRGTGFVNEFEADLIVQLLHIWARIAGHNGQPARPSFSVLAFYKAQAALIERRLARNPVPRLRQERIDSIDKIQGQESDLVVISFVRSRRDRRGRAIGAGKGTAMWLQDIHRLNVAVTRAKLALALVGDRMMLESLRGNTEAEAFYANLFGLLDQHGPDWHYIKDPKL